MTNDADKIQKYLLNQIRDYFNVTKAFIFDEKTDPLVQVLYHVDHVHLQALQDKFLKSYSVKIAADEKYSLKVFYSNSSKINDENKLKKLISAYLNLKFEIKKFNNPETVKLCKYLKYDVERIYIEFVNEDEIKIYGLVDDVEKLNQELEKSFLIDETVEPLVKILFHIDNSHLVKLQEKIATYHAIVTAEEKYNLRICYDVDQTNDAKVKNLILTYLDIEFCSVRIKGDNIAKLCKDIKYDEKNTFINIISDDEIEVLGVEDDVMALTDLINFKLIDCKTIELSLCEAQMLILYKLKKEFEEAFENFKFNLQILENSCVLNLRGKRINVFESMKRIEEIRQNMKKFPVYVTKNFEVLDQCNTELNELMKENNIKCAFEIDKNKSQLYAYLIDETKYDEVVYLVEMLEQKFEKDEEVSSKIEMQLFELRLFVIYKIDKEIKLKYPKIKVNRSKTSVELLGHFREIIRAKEIIKNFKETIICVKFAYDAVGIDYVKTNERDFIMNLAEEKMLCVVDFDLENNFFLIRTKYLDLIETYKTFIQNFIKKSE